MLGWLIVGGVVCAVGYAVYRTWPRYEEEVEEEMSFIYNEERTFVQPVVEEVVVAEQAVVGAVEAAVIGVMAGAVVNELITNVEEPVVDTPPTIDTSSSSTDAGSDFSGGGSGGAGE